MWIWLILSLVLVIASIVFGIHSFLSSRTLQRSISGGTAYRFNDIEPRHFEKAVPVLQQNTFSGFKSKLKSIEENSGRQVYQLNKLQERIAALEEGNNLKAIDEETKWEDDSEDWEKMYYETRREKEALATNLTSVNEALQQTLGKVEELERLQLSGKNLKSNEDARLNELHSLQNFIGELQLKLQGATKRENDLEQQLQQEKNIRVEYELLQKNNNQLQSETNELYNRFKEIKSQNILMEHKIKKLSELESNLEISEYEKQEVRKSLEQIMAENVSLSGKLQELQPYLFEERV